MLVETPRGTVTLEESADPEKLAKAVKSLSYLGPWCSRCGKKGPNCKNEKACRARAVKQATRGLDLKRMQGCTLPKPPREWYESHGYSYYRHYDHGGAAQQYAYEVAIGKWKP